MCLHPALQTDTERTENPPKGVPKSGRCTVFMEHHVIFSLWFTIHIFIQMTHEGILIVIFGLEFL